MQTMHRHRRHRPCHRRHPHLRGILQREHFPRVQVLSHRLSLPHRTNRRHRRHRLRKGRHCRHRLRKGRLILLLEPQWLMEFLSN